MFKLVLPKQKKEIKISDLKAKAFSPRKGWLVLVYFFIFWVLASVALSAYLFFKVAKEDVSIKEDKTGSEASLSINVPQLQEAAAFIRSRTGE